MRDRSERATELALRYLDGFAAADEVAELNGLLSDDGAAQDAFIGLSVRRQAMIESLTGGADEAIVTPIAEAPLARIEPVGRRRPLRIPRWAMAAALLIAGGLIAAYVMTQTGGAVDAPERHPLASVIGDDGVVWGSTPLAAGADVTAQTIDIAAGRLELKMRRGAIVTLHGPATLALSSPGRVELRNGFLHAVVPHEAIGFSVDTADGQVIDLGTEFVVYVGANIGTQVHVTDGRVRVSGSRGGSDVLAAGDAVVMRDGAMRSVSPLEVAYPDNAYARWRWAVEDLRRDPSLIAHYDFRFDAGGAPTTLSGASSIDSGGAAPAGSIIGATLADGRFAGKTALRFGGAPTWHRVEFDPAAHDRFNFRGSFTVAVWLRVDRFDREWQTVIAKGDSAWRIHRYQQTPYISFDTSHDGAPDSLVSQTAIDDGRWHLVVATVDAGGERRIKRLYVDGKLEAERTVGAMASNDWPLWIGANAERGDRDFAGWIDELAIFGRSLKPSEIEDLYRAGRPVGAPAEIDNRD